MILAADAARRARLTKALSADGHLPFPATSGADAADVLASPRTRPDVVVLDMRLPGPDGVTFAEAYRTAAEPHPPIVLVSAPAVASAPDGGDPVDSPAALEVLRARVRLLAQQRLPSAARKRPYVGMAAAALLLAALGSALLGVLPGVLPV